MKPTISSPGSEPISERDAAWFEELAGAVACGRGALLGRVNGFRSGPLAPSVGDTATSLISLVDAGLAAGSAVCGAVRLLLGSRPLDAVETASVLVALARSGHAIRAACAGTVHDGLNRLLDAQNRAGGWGTSDIEATADPGCPAVTGRVLEALGHYGFRVGQPPVGAAVRFILARQEESGAWFGRGGGNPICGTWQVLAGLHAIGFDMTAPVVRRAVRWLKEAQNADGGWGESGNSHGDPATAGQGESTASQTAWVLLGLLVAGEASGAEARAGAEFLVGTQRADGGWTEGPCTSTGASRGFHFEHQMDPVYFPLMALGRYASAINNRCSATSRAATRTDAGHKVTGPKGISRSTLADR